MTWALLFAFLILFVAGIAYLWGITTKRDETDRERRRLAQLVYALNRSAQRLNAAIAAFHHSSECRRETHGKCHPRRARS